jgi:anti-sigma regulatory factor (Ser/Thr protein kinase)
MARIDLAPITQWITEAAERQGDELPGYLMERLEVSRRRAGALLKRLVAAQWLVDIGKPRRPQYRPGPLRQVVKRYEIGGLSEDLPWRIDFDPYFSLPKNVRRMAQHAFTELLNNAIDHSGGSAATVSMRQTPLQLQLLVSDDGCGLFRRIAESFDIADPSLAMLELDKGKLTSAPDQHSGHGLYFTSRLADVFDIHANSSAWQRRAWERSAWRQGKAGAVSTRPGTSVYMAISLDTPRTLDKLLQAHSASGSSYDFGRTAVALQLMAPVGAMLASRADAKRAVFRLQQFRHADLDFTGISSIGHGFADELFRVFTREHPLLELHPVGMAPQVAAMVASVRATA